LLKILYWGLGILAVFSVSHLFARFWTHIRLPSDNPGMRRSSVLSLPARSKVGLAAVGVGLLPAMWSTACSGPTTLPPALGSEDGGRVFPDAGYVQPLNDGATGGCPGVNTRTDPKNCGGCGSMFACATGQSCTNGSCSACPGAQTVCSMACIDTTSDPNNCGACAHNCQGSNCQSSLCVPSPIASPGNMINDIAVDQSGTNVYWTIAGAGIGVFYKPFAGGTAMQISGGDSNPNGIAVDQDDVVWVDTGSDAIGSVPFTNGYPSGQPTYPIEPEEGGMAVNGPVAIAVDPSKPGIIYWVDQLSGTVNKMPVGGGTITPLATDRSKPVSIAVDSTYVYWIDNGMTSDGSVNKVPIVGGAATPLATGQTNPWRLAVDANYVYWTCKGNPGLVQAVPLGGGTPIVIAQGLGGPWGIAVDPPAIQASDTPPQFVYWTNYDDNNVKKAPIPSTVDAGASAAPTLLASGQNNPAAIAVDHKNVYWANQDVGTILEVAK